MNHTYYIASCVFTARYPELSARIQHYIRQRFGVPIVRCCLPQKKLRQFRDELPDDAFADGWHSIPYTAPFEPGDTVWTICHNCANLIEEMHPGVRTLSLWEVILTDSQFRFPDHTGTTVTVQDCWRAHHRPTEQEAVRKLLDRIHITWVEASENHDDTRFCGISLLKEQHPRNPSLAPRFYRDRAAGIFLPTAPEEQITIMRKHCAAFQTRKAVCYCHYCLDGLRLGGADAQHLAELLFPGEIASM